eukprot:TRINITY_DN8909_c0_g1_i1.p1 TRINITY_DN8909_c0_g1~~TRINITY_DN8909_c0_g1_i1.p1  ORF type:complete len:600 (-),score=163.41 TRINITY_DN8909_c0_g1_i1:115-1845(-)
MSGRYYGSAPLLRLSWTGVLLISFVSLFCAGRFGTAAKTYVVDADCGLIEGYVSNNTVNKQIVQFLGIPYASPPVGDLRWKHPVSLQATNSCWTDVLQANAFGNYCVQPGGGDEDCLYLNIWTPVLQYDQPLPVLFYIHGGGLNGGSGEFDGVPFVDEATHPVILVTINYRLNGFGFMALEVLAENDDHNGASGNYGIGDMIFALQWVQTYISAFGGDPNRITISGQSSGGTGVLALLISPLASGLFNGAILMSSSTRIDYTIDQAFAQNQVFFNRTNCTTADSPIDCLYDLTAEQVLNALPWNIYPYWGHPDDFGLPIPSHGDGAMLLIVDGYVITDSAYNVLSGNSTTPPNDVPTIFGTMEQENDAGPAANLTGYTIEEYNEYITNSFTPFSEYLPSQVLSLYNITTRFENNPQLAYETLTSDLRVTCGQNLLSQFAATTFQSPVYRYVVTQKPSSPVYLSGPPPSGWGSRYSFHTLDLFSVFNIWSEVTPPPPYEFVPDENDDLLGDLLRDFFTELTTTGSISSPLWPVINVSGNDNYTTALLNLPIETAVDWRKEECQFWFDNGFYFYSWNS